MTLGHRSAFVGAGRPSPATVAPHALRLPDAAFTAHTGTDPDGQVHRYRLAETTVELPLNRTGGTVALRQVHRQAVDGTQIPVLTSRTDLPAAEVCWRLSAHWRQENYFKYARAHFALDAQAASSAGWGVLGGQRADRVDRLAALTALAHGRVAANPQPLRSPEPRDFRSW